MGRSDEDRGPAGSRRGMVAWPELKLHVPTPPRYDEVELGDGRVLEFLAPGEESAITVAPPPPPCPLDLPPEPDADDTEDKDEDREFARVVAVGVAAALVERGLEISRTGGTETAGRVGPLPSEENGGALNEVPIATVKGGAGHGVRPSSARYLTIDQVAERYQLSRRSMQRLMSKTLRASISAPWVRIGRTVRFDGDRVDPWMEDISKWQASKEGAAGIRSDGGRSPGSSNGANARPSRRRRASSLTSKPPSPMGTTGRLKSLAKLLTSKK